MADDRLIYRRFFLTASLVIGLCVSGIFLGLAMRSKTLLHEQMLARARALFGGIVLTRAWNALHGGVYVFKGPGEQSNPFLENPDLKAADGRMLTLKNPAIMTREISELADDKNLFLFRITSLKPLNPRNEADAFEARALESFEAGAREAFVQEDGPAGEPRFRYMAPLLVDQTCMSCHARQGYRVGQVRGGISVTFGTADVARALRQNAMTIAALSLATLGLLLLTLRHFFRKMQFKLDESQSQLRTLATVDTLTGVANRRALMDRFGESFARHRRLPISLGCLMLDVDHFKAVNDRFGHQRGDAVLTVLSFQVLSLLRPYDVLGRYGGEEFLVVLEGLDKHGLAEVAERIRVLLEERLGAQAGLDEPVTVSLGGTLAGPQDQSIEDIIRRADQALYLAKNQGRNRVVLLEPEAAAPAPEA